MVKYVLSFLLLCSFYINANAQKNFFIYIESEAKEPFYVLINGKINYSSSMAGFLTIPQMTNGYYDAEIGFVKSKYPEQHFIISITGMDVGFILRSAKDNTFGLLDLQTFATLTPINIIQKMVENRMPNLVIAPQKISPFANKLKQKPNCIIATDADYNMVKKQMGVAKTELEMMIDAKPTFAEKCFSTEEIKNLGKLFTTDKNRLAFFLEARSSIYDEANYASLQGQLTDPAIIKQFRNAQ